MKKSYTLILFYGFIILPASALFMISGARNLNEWITTIFFVVLSAISLAILALTKSDEQYYNSLTSSHFVWAVVVGLGMIGLSWGLSLQLGKPDMLLSVNRPYPLLQEANIPLTYSALTLTPVATSVITLLLSSLIYGLAMPAQAEEVFKLVGYAEGKARWGNGYKIGAVTIPGVFIYVGFPVGFWAAMHGIQAYDNPVMILPAFVNGVVLIIYLWKFECILGCIFAHWIYNGGILLITYLTGSLSSASGLPFFPNIFDRAYFANSGFIYDALLLFIFVAGVLFFFLPSIRGKGK